MNKVFFVYIHFIGTEAIIYAQIVTSFVCLFDMILYIIVNKFSVMLGRVFLC